MLELGHGPSRAVPAKPLLYSQILHVSGLQPCSPLYFKLIVEPTWKTGR